MLNMQRDLQLRINKGKSIIEFTDEERMAALRENVLALEDELHEALHETGWKPWAKTNHLNQDAFHGELVDAFHFFMNLMLHSGMTMTDLYERYLKKNVVNHQRQIDGYDGISSKCPSCHRDLGEISITTVHAGNGEELHYCVCEFPLSLALVSPYLVG
jgi:dimeric dUTPase (all-alpha-NTP-PPase superfamily)